MTYSTLKVEKNNIRKINIEVVQALLNKLQLCQQVSSLGFIGKNQVITAIQRVCDVVSKLKFALFTFTTSFEKLFFKLESSIII